MKILLARFSLFLIMVIGVAGSTFVQGSPSDTPNESTVCVTEIASISGGGLSATRQKAGGSTTRAVRWQSLLPGAFR